MTTALRKTLALLVAMMMVFAVAVMAMPSVLAEGTDEDQVTEDEVTDEETDDTDVAEDDVPADETDDAADENAPQTGDASANMIVVAAAAALVAAGALTFVMKKARN